MGRPVSAPPELRQGARYFGMAILLAATLTFRCVPI
jgi:hypothetical protein